MGDWSRDETAYELLKTVLAQNDRLIDMLSKSLPVDVIKALNPPISQVQTPEAPYSMDMAVSRPLDPWSDEAIPDEEAIHGAVGGWLDVPGLQEAKATSGDLGAVQEAVKQPTMKERLRDAIEENNEA